MPRVFISYAREDHKIAQQLRADLIARGIDTWLDQEDILPGQEWEAAIRGAIKDSSHFLALISNNSVSKRGFVQKELRMGIDVLDEFPPGQVFLIPVRIDDVRPSHSKLEKLQWVDLWPSYERARSRVILAIRGKKSLLDRGVFAKIISSINPDQSLKRNNDGAEVKELTKRLLFYAVREIFYFPFEGYQELIEWLRQEGYEIPPDLTFQSSQQYNNALMKVERLNRLQIDVKDVKCALFFSAKLPLRLADEWTPPA